MHSPSDDERLLARMSEGDRDALDSLVRKWEASMLTMAYRITGQMADAEEVRQNVLMRIVKNPASLPPLGRFPTWLRRCVINESISILRRRKRAPSDNDAVISDVASDDNSPLSQMIQTDDAEQLRRALQALPCDTRVLMTLRFDDSLSIREIADIVEKPHTTVHAQLQQAIRAIRHRLFSFNSGERP